MARFSKTRLVFALVLAVVIGLLIVQALAGALLTGGG
jgi:hypothetical protein